MTALRKALAPQPAQPAQPEQAAPKAINQVLTLHEGWYDVPDGQEYVGTVLETRTVYTDPPAAQPAKPLTDAQIAELALDFSLPYSTRSFARAIEAAHGITGETK